MLEDILPQYGFIWCDFDMKFYCRSICWEKSGSSTFFFIKKNQVLNANKYDVMNMNRQLPNSFVEKKN